MLPLAAADSVPSPAEDYALIERAIAYIETHYAQQPGLDEIAAVLGISPLHLQRLFTRWAGISPKRFLQAVTLRHAKSLLLQSRDILGATLEVGLSSPGRMHDLFVTCEAVTPGDYKARGRGLTLRYGVHETKFGHALIAVTDKGICELTFFTQPGEAAASLARLQAQWRSAELREDARATASYMGRIFDLPSGSGPLPLYLKGTNFQIKVWQALLRIPSGSLVSYEDIAAQVGAPTAMRAVGSAVGSNPVAWLIPCHRVFRKSGAIGGYATGTPRKRAMLAHELKPEE